MSHTPEAPPPTASERALFISIRPQFVEAILAGSKTVELRRTRPNVEVGSLVIFYSSSPTRAIVGWASLAGMVEGTPDQLWDDHGERTAIAEDEYDLYFAGANAAYGLELEDVVQALKPVPLETIRSLGIEPPQSWRYVHSDLGSRIRDHAGRKAASA
jgi:predicted transcriptional regulator